MTIIDAILANHIAVTNRADVVIREAEEELQKASRYKVRSNFIAPTYPADMSILNAQLDALARD
jgi:hypothetical protein